MHPTCLVKTLGNILSWVVSQIKQMMSQVSVLVWLILNSPVILDPAFLQALAISPLPSPGLPSPSPHLLLIPSLTPQYLYHLTLTFPLPECLVYSAKLSSVWWCLVTCPARFWPLPACLLSDLEFPPCPPNWICLPDCWISWFWPCLSLTWLNWTFWTLAVSVSCYWVLICSCECDTLSRLIQNQLLPLKHKNDPKSPPFRELSEHKQLLKSLPSTYQLNLATKNIGGALINFFTGKLNKTSVKNILSLELIENAKTLFNIMQTHSTVCK